MIDDLLFQWKKRVEARQDLTSLYNRKTVRIAVNLETEGYYLVLTPKGLCISTEKEKQIDVNIYVTDDIFIELLNGKEKLTLLPGHLAKCKGKYRDILLFESLLYLTSP